MTSSTSAAAAAKIFTDTLPIKDCDLHSHELRRRKQSRHERQLSEPAVPKNQLADASLTRQTAADAESICSRNLPMAANDLRDQADNLVDSFLEVPVKCVEQVKEAGKIVIEYVVDHSRLPTWLSDNEFLLSGHRPPMPSVKQCFASIFRLHTETVNIWTHLIGTLFFIGIAIYFISRPASEVQWEEKIIFGAFFVGAIVCLLCSTLFHTLYCHSPKISKLFNKLDYCGISILIFGSFVPWLYFAFYCEFGTKVAYLSVIALLGAGCIVVSLWDQFSEPKYRVYRALLFIAMGLFGIVPTTHYILAFGFKHAFTTGALQWLVLMAVLYITGAALYAARIPERLKPGFFDIWFQSHQIFHVFVVAAAVVHFYGICVLSNTSRHRASKGHCGKGMFAGLI